MNINSLLDEFNKEIKGIEYGGIFPKVGNIAYRSYQARLFTYKIIEIQDKNSLVVMKNTITDVILYAKFQTNKRSSDKGKFCLATKTNNGGFKCWTKHDIFGGHGYIITMSNFTNEIALKQNINPL